MEEQLKKLLTIYFKEVIKPVIDFNIAISEKNMLQTILNILENSTSKEGAMGYIDYFIGLSEEKLSKMEKELKESIN